MFFFQLGVSFLMYLRLFQIPWNYMESPFGEIKSPLNSHQIPWSLIKSPLKSHLVPFFGWINSVKSPFWLDKSRWISIFKVPSVPALGPSGGQLGAGSLEAGSASSARPRAMSHCRPSSLTWSWSWKGGAMGRVFHGRNSYCIIEYNWSLNI